MIARHTDDFLWSAKEIAAQLNPHVHAEGDCLIYTGENHVVLELRGKGREITKDNGYKRRMIAVDEKGRNEKLAGMAAARAALLASMERPISEGNADAFIPEDKIAVHRAECPNAKGGRIKGRFHVCINHAHLYVGTQADAEREAEARKAIAAAPKTVAA
jgi:hypothetical protein